MDFGLHIADFTYTGGPARLGPALAAHVRNAEASGIRRITVMDHFWQLPGIGPEDHEMLEAYATLGFLVAHTEKVLLHTLVTGVIYRHPALLAKQVTTLDVLSGGRASLGIGAAWYEEEHQGLGVPFPPVAERFERLEETLQICLQMWSDDDGPYSGRHYQLAETLCRPRPISSPRPKILIGGGGEKKTLRLVAQYADACNLFVSSPEDVQHKIEVLNRHCEDVGRDPGEIRKTVLAFGDPSADPDGFVRSMEPLAALGVELAEVMPLTPDPVAYAAALGPVVERLADL